MKEFDKIINIFNKIIQNIKSIHNIHNIHIRRKIKEKDYFGIYLKFLHNSTYFSRFEYIFNSNIITVYKYFMYGHISDLFNKMKLNKDDLLCFETPIKYLCHGKTSIFSSKYIITGNLLFLDFLEDTIIQSGDTEYKLSKNDGFPIYSTHFMTSRMKYYGNNK